MRSDLALDVLGKIMEWNDAQAVEEFRWLDFMSRAKFDGYQDYLAGARFIESLAAWLQQFADRAEREAAYRFVRTILVYVGPAEMQALVDLFYPSEVERRLLRSVAQRLDIAPYRVWADASAAKAFDRLLRRTLFVGLSEGAHLDRFRRVNSGVISHEQVLVAPHVGREKWDRVADELQSATGDPQATFRFVYLIDDFTASGTTFIRRKDGVWKGKLAAFRGELEEVRRLYFDPELTVCVHHYLATTRASEELPRKHAEALSDQGSDAWFPDVRFSFGAVFVPDFPLDASPLEGVDEFVALARKYCDRADPLLDNRHFREGDTQDPAMGFADCALPLVLEHNTPNNSVAILWAETPTGLPASGDVARHAMKPLFRRRQRHV